MSLTLLHIRYYDQHLEPSSFKERGFRGWVVIALNWLRYWLETFIQYQVLLCGVEKAGLEKAQKKSLIQQFLQDVKEERKEASSPFLPTSSSPSSILRRERYKSPRGERVLVEDGDSQVLVSPSTGKPIDSMVAERVLRSYKRYATSEPTTLEEAFESVEPESR